MLATQRVYERDTDAAFLRLVRGAPEIGAAFISGLENARALVKTVEGQIRHKVDTGSIDISIEYDDGTVLLVENKIRAAYSLTKSGQSQPPRYARSIAALRAAGCNAFSVLIAPNVYLGGARESVKFDIQISYEMIRDLLSGKDRELLECAIATSELPYEPVPNHFAGAFFEGVKQVVADRFPMLSVKRDPNENGVRPSESRTIYFDVPKSLLGHSGVVRPRMSLQCWDTSAPSASVKIMLSDRARLAKTLSIPDTLRDIGAYLRPAGRSLGIAIDTPRLETQKPVDLQLDEICDALEAAACLQGWWNANGDLLRAWCEA